MENLFQVRKQNKLKKKKTPATAQSTTVLHIRDEGKIKGFVTFFFLNRQTYLSWRISNNV